MQRRHKTSTMSVSGPSREIVSGADVAPGSFLGRPKGEGRPTSDNDPPRSSVVTLNGKCRPATRCGEQITIVTLGRMPRPAYSRPWHSRYWDARIPLTNQGDALLRCREREARRAMQLGLRQ